MSLNNSNNSAIKIIILDLYPSYSELNPTNEEMLLIFEGINIYFYLNDLLTSHQKIEIKNNNHSSIIVSLIKTNNILASGTINLKNGEQWVTMNSDNKKKSNMNLALSLIDCIKLKIFCEIKNVNKNGINSNNNNNVINNSLNINNLNNSVNLTNRVLNKTKQKINQMNLKISKKNINNKMMIRGSPKKINLDIYSSRRSPKASLNRSNKIKYAASDLINKNPLKYNNSNFNSINHQNSIKDDITAFSTINKQSIKKIDMNSSNKTRNSNLEKRSPTKYNYSSLRASNHNGMRKINTSAFNLNNINKINKSKITPDIKIKELHNVKNLGGSPKLFHKNRLDEDIYKNMGNSGDKAILYGEKTLRNINIEKNYLTNNYINNNDINQINKGKSKNSFSNNILNINYENNNNIINMNIVSNINDNQYKTINGNNYSNFNNTYGTNFNKQDLKNKILYPIEQNQIFVNHPYNCIKDKNLTSHKKKEFERALNSFEDYDDKKLIKIKENNKVSEKMGVYKNKRLNIKKNKTQINKKKNEKSSNLEKILTQNTEENFEEKEKIDIKENNQNENNLNKECLNFADNEMDDIINDENSNFERLKKDFLLLYNDNYVNDIQEDLLKLEIELFFEKIVELMQCYHTEYYQRKMEKEIFLNNFKSNFIEYKKIQKLIKNLEIRKIDNEKDNKVKHQKGKNNEVNICKSEIEIFKNFFKDKNNEKNKNILKNIFNKIIHNKKNSNIINMIDNEKLELLLNTSNNLIIEKKLLSPVYQRNTIKYTPK